MHANTDDVCVIDEIQMIADPERGGAWTRALLGISEGSLVQLAARECMVA